MKIILQYIAYVLWPPYRHSCDREYAWWQCIDAVSYLVLREECDKNDIAAARFLNEHARQFIPSKVQ